MGYSHSPLTDSATDPLWYDEGRGLLFVICMQCIIGNKHALTASFVF